MDNQESVDLGPSASVAPSDHSPVVSGSRIESFGYALAGCRHMLRWQKNTRILSTATAIVAIVAVWSDISALEWALLILTVALVWLAEFINAAIEAAVNLGSPGLHPMAKVAKDVAAAAVLMTVLASVLVGALILGPPILGSIRDRIANG